MIVIIVEDGTGIPDANSYNTVESVKKYMTDRGVPAPQDEELASKLIQATDWLETVGGYKGQPATTTQALAFPRTGVYVGGAELPHGVVPASLKTAHAQLVLDTVKSDSPLLSGATEFALKMRKLGPLTQEWATGTSPQVKPADPHTRVWSLLRDLRNNVGQGVMR